MKPAFCAAALAVGLFSPSCRAADRDWRALGEPAAVPDVGPARELAPAAAPDKAAVLDLRPTQMTVGMKEVERKRDKLRSLGHEERKAFLKERPVPVVRGPAGLYIIDHHHLSRAAWEAGVDHVYIRLMADWSALGEAEFWRKMAEAKWVYPYDRRGEKRDVGELPKDVRGLADDPYRSVAGFVRERGGYEKTTAPFAEFAWANFFRTRLSTDPAERFQEAVKEADKLALEPAARDLPGYEGR